MSQESNEVIFYRRLSGIKPLYNMVKYAVILSENFDPDREYYIASSNQMRSALDHIFKAMDDDEKIIDYEIKEAKEHLDRAGYDAYEILVSNISVNILDIIEKYSASVISHVFPEYYKEIKPSINTIQYEIGKVRTEKKKDTGLQFDIYMQRVENLIRFEDRVYVMIPAMEEYKKYEKRKSLIYWAFTILVAIIFLIIGKLI